MGTSMAFCNIMNVGFTREDLNEKIKVIAEYSKSKSSGFDKMLEQFVPPETLKQYREEIAQANAALGQDARDNRPVIAYCETARWLPLFEEHLCEGNVISDSDLKLLNSIFGAPVLAFSVFDSDVMFVSYMDDEQNIYNHLKPNIDEFEEYDADFYSKDFPQFLLRFCDEDKAEDLMALWDRDGYVFADDRMLDICNLLGIYALNYGIDTPEEYELIFAD